ncbi:putative ferric nocobactin-binding protein [Nocardia nova SH22a]|uniref:Putative ferric nocobactin-binding protein n=1 Tax=Nocardia nova SH22a TaxID=1415166 RepID=W5T8X5_9NOCA|nr:ABC transporter substrate-binding protein [Nocardia nova]AHH15672.1 putative ferric nocobactin-binding protein [Nocardia nova SH22a]
MNRDRASAPRTGRVRIALRRAGLVVMAFGLVTTAVACGSSDDDANSGGSVTIDHSLGKTEIQGTPKRVVAIGNQWVETAVALGVKPVGYLIPGAGPNASAPWLPAAQLEGSKALTAGGDTVEQVAALEPDLILAPNYLMDKAMYEKFSKLAPTVANVSGSQIDPWQDEVTALGKALHKDDEAKKVISDVDGKIDAVAAKYPKLKGKTFLTCLLSTPTQLMVLADPKDGSAQTFIRLGLTMPEKLVAEAPAGGRLALSPERLGDLSSDLLVCGAVPGMQEKFTALPGYSDLPSVRQGGLAFVDMTTINGINVPTALSVPYVLDKLEPTLANVAK